MMIVAMYVTFLRLVDSTAVQSETEPETGSIGDSFTRFTTFGKINSNSRRPIVLVHEDKETRNERWEPERENRRTSRPRPFEIPVPIASLSHRTDQRSHGEKFFTLHDETVGVSSGSTEEPSPILLPPYVDGSSHVRRVNVDESVAVSPDETSTRKFADSSALGRIRIYEITRSNASMSLATRENATSPEHDTSRLLDITDERKRWTNFSRRSYVNETGRKNDGQDDEDETTGSRDYSFSSSVDQTPRNAMTMNPRISRYRNREGENLRGGKKYRDYFTNERALVLANKGSYLGGPGYEWHGPNLRRINRPWIGGDRNENVGSVPGIPGRDYPIHQEHTHHHLRNVIDRFACPQLRRSHLYLADRASRCQIFYVCYGSKTGVPMVCPNGTLFSQQLQVCDWWYNVVC